MNGSMWDLSTFHTQSMERINSAFFENGDGLAAVAARSQTVDEIVRGYIDQYVPEERQEGFAALAVGGYGRAQLFPFSDVDLLFLVRSEAEARERKDDIATLLTALWDANLRVSQSVRTPAECVRLAPDNSELHISMLDTRFLTGDRALYEDLASNRLPAFFAKERKTLLTSLVEMARQRHKTFNNTIYHLEPDIKEGPGGLRDLQLACWLSQLAHVTSDRIPGSEEFIPADFRDALAEGKRFLFAARCYLHYFSSRDNNRLAFDLQDSIADASAGASGQQRRSAADWMREYYRNVRVIDRLALRMMDEFGVQRNSLFAILRDRTSKLSNQDFSVAHGRVFFRYSQAAEQDPAILLRMFRFVARHGLPLALKTERLATAALDAFRGYVNSAPDGLWNEVADMLRQPHAYEAMTALHETGALFVLFPELEQIDCLVIRDFYHRYTVDEHSFQAIRRLKTLQDDEDALTKRFARLLAEVERPERLMLALLYHDVGKGGSGEEDHAVRSLHLLDHALERLRVPSRDAEPVRFLVESHLAMSNYITKRDISDPETIREFVDLVGTRERLRALTLMTYADTAAVNPKAMTAWRKELLWQLYLSTFNRLTANAEDRRIESDSAAPVLALGANDAERDGLRRFLKGFPLRYLRTQSPEQIKVHYEMRRELAEKSAIVHVERRDQLYDVAVVAWDRPFLFASLCGAMAGFGLNIERAEAFANEEGVILDTFSVAMSESRGGEMDETEMRSLARTLKRVVDGREDVRNVLSKRKKLFGPRGRMPIEPEVAFDNEASSRASIFHVIAEDRTGLLFDLTSAFSHHGYDIEVVLIETQGRKAIDVFYVVGPGGKLSEDECRELTDQLRGACRSKAA
ncbi:MAG: [protein-PII] uridylyltransferase [Bryobacterales bacterium]